MDRALFKVDQLSCVDIMMHNSIPLLQGNVVIFMGRRKCSHLDLAYKLNYEKEVSVLYFHSTYKTCMLQSISLFKFSLFIEIELN